MSKSCALSCVKQLALNSTVIFESLIHFSFGSRLLPDVVGYLMLSYDNRLDFPITVSVSSVGIVKAL